MWSEHMERYGKTYKVYRFPIGVGDSEQFVFHRQLFGIALVDQDLVKLFIGRLSVAHEVSRPMVQNYASVRQVRVDKVVATMVALATFATFYNSHCRKMIQSK